MSFHTPLIFIQLHSDMLKSCMCCWLLCIYCVVCCIVSCSIFLLLMFTKCFQHVSICVHCCAFVFYVTILDVRLRVDPFALYVSSSRVLCVCYVIVSCCSILRCLVDTCIVVLLVHIDSRVLCLFAFVIVFLCL